MAKNKGYVSIWRDIQDNSIWTCDKCFSKGQAWVDLILMANHEEKTFLLGNEVVKAEVGSVITSEKRLMERWKWSKEKTRRFLKLLEEVEMIERRPDHSKTYILICNYSKYQTTNQTTTNRDKIKADKKDETAIQTENRPQADQEQTANQTQTITTNNYTIIKNNKDRVVRHKYGEYKNVLLSDEEIENLKSEYPTKWENKLEALSEYMMTHNKSYKSHYATIKAWIRKDLEEREEQKDESGDKGKVFDLFL